MKSMTGFGKSEIAVDGRKIRVEIKSVNHRFLDINVRMPRFLLFLEDDIRKYLKTVLSRGRVDVFVNYSSEREDSKKIVVDMAMIHGYFHAAQEIEKSLGINNNVQTAELLRLPDAVTFEENDSDETAMKELLLKTVETAAGELIAAREAEGRELVADIVDRLALILKTANEIEGKEDIVLAEYRQKLTDRIAELLD
ncbi:MAG: YicC/YloC family endoribonuclease, partial [Eubacteriales bacterium]